MEGRNITETFLIANEIIDYWKKKWEKGVVCELDLEKTHANIHWNFLMEVMKCLGFSSKWVGWI